MTWTDRCSLSVVELIIYLCFTPITVYTLYKHRLPSLLGHIFFFAFYILRIVTDILTISERNDASPSTTAAIINSVGLSPLLLASSGFVAEARNSLIGVKSSRNGVKVGFIIELILHILVMTGIALLAVGSSKAADADNSTDAKHDRHVADVGVILLLLAWIAILIWAVVTFRSAKKAKGPGQRLPLRLVTAILLSSPFLAIRVFYSVVYIFDYNAHINPEQISFGGYLFLVFLSQICCAAIILIGLLLTRGIKQEVTELEQYSMAGMENNRGPGKQQTLYNA